jgi:uncharacterized membrane protein YeaQ/YmgE (transglycosylase-associated protein family)
MVEITRTPAAPDGLVDRLGQLKVCGILIAVLAVVGAILGVVWEAWSPQGTAGLVLEHGIQAVESEAFVAGDGRFAVITGVVGLIAGVLAWYLRPLQRMRGPLVAVALVIGALVGAALTEWVAYLLRGDGNHFECNSATRVCIDHLPLSVHMHALLLVEAILAVLVYSLFVAFAVADDLGRPDPWRAPKPDLPDDPASAFAAPGGSTAPPPLGTQGGAQHAEGHGDAPGPA